MPTIPYTLSDGSPVKGATTMLQSVSFMPADPLMYWACKLQREGKDFKVERRRAADRGTRLHTVVELWPEPPTRQENEPDEWWLAALTLYSQFTAWVEKSGATMVLREEPMVHELQRFGGCPDLVARFGDELVLCDLKTGKSWGDKKTVAQLAAYANLLAQCKGITISRAIVLHFDAKAKLHAIDVSTAQLAAGWKVFSCALTLTAALNELGDAE